MDDSTGHTGFHPVGINTGHALESEAEASEEPDVRSTNRSGPGGRIPFGMDRFDANAREDFGHKLRVFMACVDGSGLPARTPDPDREKQESDLPDGAIPNETMPDEAPAIARRLRQLNQDISCNTADLLELLVRFDELDGWKRSGARHCVAWMNLEMGIGMTLGWEYLRVGRKLRTLPMTRALFRSGKLTWSIVRLLSRVADADNEALLCHTALDASVSEVERLCADYRWQPDPAPNAEEEAGNAENLRSLQQIDARSLTWRTLGNGNTRIALCLPPELAQAFLHSVEHAMARLEDTDAAVPLRKSLTMAQRRADAAVLMAENSLQNAGRDIATADRYQVIVSMPVPGSAGTAAITPAESTANVNLPDKRPTLQEAGPIARETARRIACDCCISSITHDHGEPVDIGRKSRLWPPAMARAIKHRDRHCQYPGCTQTRHLQIHHIRHWADGGGTRVDNGVCLCSHHHGLVHEGGYRIERASDTPCKADRQFQRQRTTKNTVDDVEQRLRDSRESFELVRSLSPTRFRFRVVDRDGRDIRDDHALFDERQHAHTDSVHTRRLSTHA